MATSKLPFIRNPYNYDRDEVSRETGLDCTGDPGYTQQQFRDECDINEIVRRFGLTGEMPDDFRAPVSGDFTDIPDFKTAMDAVTGAHTEFMRMPPELRARFLNDPQRLLEFVSNDANRAEAEALGILRPKQDEPPPIRVALQSPSPATPPANNGNQTP